MAHPRAVHGLFRRIFQGRNSGGSVRGITGSRSVPPDSFREIPEIPRAIHVLIPGSVLKYNPPPAEAVYFLFALPAVFTGVFLHFLNGRIHRICRYDSPRLRKAVRQRNLLPALALFLFVSTLIMNPILRLEERAIFARETLIFTGDPLQNWEMCTSRIFLERISSELAK